MNEERAVLGFPLYRLVAQPHLEESAVVFSRAGARVESASVSYSYFGNGADHSDPANEVVLAPHQRRSIAAAEESGLDEDVKRLVHRLRYPAIWDAIRTSTAPTSRGGSLEHRLATHVAAVQNARILPGPVVSSQVVRVDDVEVRGIAFPSLTGLVAFAATIGPRSVTVVLPSSYLARLDLALTSSRPDSSD